VFTKNGICEQPLSEETIADIQTAYELPSRKYAIDLTGGVHALQLDAVLLLLKWLRVELDDQSWELGCGEMKLAFALSCAAEGGLVLATDQGNQYTIYLFSFMCLYCLNVLGDPYEQLVNALTNYSSAIRNVKKSSHLSRRSTRVQTNTKKKQNVRRPMEVDIDNFGNDDNDSNDDDDVDDIHADGTYEDSASDSSTSHNISEECDSDRD
jgi:hypothetical protein